jgi:hypothetical protein
MLNKNATASAATPGATGAEMTILEKADIRNHVAVVRNTRQPSSESLASRHRAIHSERDPGTSSASKSPFTEDFILEHSLPGLHSGSIDLSDNF